MPLFGWIFPIQLRHRGTHDITANNNNNTTGTHVHYSNTSCFTSWDINIFLWLVFFMLWILTAARFLNVGYDGLITFLSFWIIFGLLWLVGWIFPSKLRIHNHLHNGHNGHVNNVIV